MKKKGKEKGAGEGQVKGKEEEEEEEEQLGARLDFAKTSTCLSTSASNFTGHRGCSSFSITTASKPKTRCTADLSKMADLAPNATFVHCTSYERRSA